ncbi:hypothetical protein MNBD_GAMMA07-1854 [hydrothermal vent metagenome]|uniref:Zn-ribbon-containing, possibly RNA-binding protein and truncated derivatives n=1 Tax=hydrothermal vent metagenome TaxID=652676 RepID=A0A3B0X5E8_9ZZZZ
MDNISNKISLKLSKKALELQHLNLAVKASLPKDCRDHMEIAAIRDKQLIIVTDSPVWQTRLRMYSQTILEGLHQHTGIKLNRVYLKLTPETRIIEAPAPVYRMLSQENAKLIEQTANSVSDDGLQAALLNLSLKTKPKPYNPKK